MKNYKGLNELTKEEQKITKTLTKEYFGKIKLILKQLKHIDLEIKVHNKKPGILTNKTKRKRYEIGIKAIAPRKILRTKVEEWDIAKTLHKGYKKIIKEAKHQLPYAGRNIKTTWRMKGLLKKAGIFKR
jgi:hypothetical protein